jgi:hypothetical protein
MTTRSNVMRRCRIREVLYTSAIRWTAELGSAAVAWGPDPPLSIFGSCLQRVRPGRAVLECCT